MSARQPFIPRPASVAPLSEPPPHSTDMCARDGDRDLFVNGSDKARSITAFLGQKRGTGTDAASHGAGPTQGPGLSRANSSTTRRGFEGLLRPEMIPMSIISYPTTTGQLGAAGKQPSVGQTPRKAMGQGAFPRPMTPVSMPRGLKRGYEIAESREDEATPDENAHRDAAVFMGPGSGADGRVGAGTGIGGYMRAFEGSGGAASAGGVQSSLEHNIAAPVPEYAVRGLGNSEDEDREVDGLFARSSRSLDAMSEREVGMERNDDLQRTFEKTKRGMRREDMEESRRFTNEDLQSQGSAKRAKQTHMMQHDPDEYIPISSPHISPTPAPPSSFVEVLDPSMVASSLFDNIEEFVNLDEIAADWKIWRECTTEEWLKDADKLAQDYADILNLVKDHLTEKVITYASMISSVEERRTQVNSKIEIIRGKGSIVRENISKLGTKK